MPTVVRSLLEQALELSPTDRAMLADMLLASLEPTDPKRDEFWAREAEARIAAVEAGEMETFSAEEVFAELKRERVDT